MNFANYLANLPWWHFPPKVEQAAVRNYVHDSDLGDCVPRARAVPTLQEDPKRYGRKSKSNQRKIQRLLQDTKRGPSELSEKDTQALQLEQALNHCCPEK